MHVACDIAWSVYHLKMLLLTWWLAFHSAGCLIISIVTDLLYFAKRNETNWNRTKWSEAKWNRIKWNETNQKECNKDIYQVLQQSEFFWKRSKTEIVQSLLQLPKSVVFFLKNWAKRFKTPCFTNYKVFKFGILEVILTGQLNHPFKNPNSLFCTLHSFTALIGRLVNYQSY